MTPDAIAAYIDAISPALGLALPAPRRDAVVPHLARLMDMGALVARVRLPDDPAEPRA